MSRFGCLKDEEDERDLMMMAYIPPEEEIIMPESLDYIYKMTPVRNQGLEGTCVAFATVTGVKEYQEQEEYQKYIKLSPRYLYHHCKEIDRRPDEEGTTIRSAMKVLKNLGVCLEKLWPYIPLKEGNPEPGVNENAAQYKEKTYARIRSISEVKRTLIVHGPCVVGIICFPSIMETTKGYIPMPKLGEKPEGGHALCIVGYDDRKSLFKFKNSWGEDWGDKGYGYLSYEYMENYMMDAWTMVDIVEKR